MIKVKTRATIRETSEKDALNHALLVVIKVKKNPSTCFTFYTILAGGRDRNVG